MDSSKTDKADFLKIVVGASAIAIVALIAIVFLEKDTPRSEVVAPNDSENPTIILVDQATTTAVAQVLQTTSTEQVEPAEPPLPCADTWDRTLADLKAGKKSALSQFEKCVVLRGYPFKKFLIPGHLGSYYGFMGNYTIKGEATCTNDAYPNGCLVYKLNDGVLSVPVKGVKDFWPRTPIGALANGELAIRQDPYEICYFLDYYSTSFSSSATQHDLVSYDEAGSCSATSTLAFYPTSQKKVLISILPNDQASSMSLSYNGKSIGELSVAPSDVWKENKFPLEEDLKAYALQADRSFYAFKIGDSSYRLNVLSQPPKLTKLK